MAHTMPSIWSMLGRPDKISFIIIFLPIVTFDRNDGNMAIHCGILLVI